MRSIDQLSSSRACQEGIAISKDRLLDKCECTHQLLPGAKHNSGGRQSQELNFGKPKVVYSEEKFLKTVSDECAHNVISSTRN